MNEHDVVQAWRNAHSKAKMLDFGTFGGTERAADPRHWISSSNISNVCFGTGHSIYTDTIIPAITSATTEVVIITCFWARSPTLDSLSQALIQLSQRHCRSRQREHAKIRVRVCFSSASLLQKIFHTSSLAGRRYGSDEWTRKLGLPPKEDLAGSDLEVKSIFVLPFSVMHPKFIIIDRQKVVLPSCNVSWEAWFEGAVEMCGPIVQHFVSSWKNFWANETDLEPVSTGTSTAIGTSGAGLALIGPKLLASTSVDSKDVPAIFLPSAHHRSPRFAFPWRPCRPPPSTPLNTFLLTSFSNAHKDVYLQTPNLTAPPVLSALLAALKRGVNVTILTSERLMILEQLVTAGTTTKRCVWKLLKRHRQLVERYDPSQPDVESGTIAKPGQLNVRFFVSSQLAEPPSEEPVQSHVKVTIIDSEITLLGSGNMDRASWFTSQELEVAFVSADFARLVRSQLDDLMRTRSRLAN